jgi:hypothetical protein
LDGHHDDADAFAVIGAALLIGVLVGVVRLVLAGRREEDADGAIPHRIPLASGVAAQRKDVVHQAAREAPRPLVPAADASAAASRERDVLSPHHAALLLHQWQYEGETADHAVSAMQVHTYSHPILVQHRVSIAASGQWQHTKIGGASASGASADELARHLAAIHGTASLADLVVPGRRGD